MKTIARLLIFILMFGVMAAFSAQKAAAGPYAPAAGEPGSTAVHMDDAAFTAWATGWEGYDPGAAVDAQWQTPGKALGKAQGTPYDIVCLGRGGVITMTFAAPIRDGAGWDFAVFENSFSDAFLELAYVEVSSNGTSFTRFPNDSLTPVPVSAYGTLDPTDVDGLAGKYKGGYGTPFDLADVGLDNVTHVRIVDIVGDGTDLDSDGDQIYDPYPTTGSAGLDLDAVGVRYQGDAPVLPPSASTGSADDVTQVSATLNGTVNPNGQDTTYYFEYGTTTSYGSTSATGSAGSGGSSVDVSKTISGLSAGTTYHYRLVAESDGGTTQGSDQSFTTDSTPVPPSVSTGSASGVGVGGATLNGTVNPSGLATTYYFEYGTTTGYGSTSGTGSAGSGSSSVDVSETISGLSEGTTYHYRLVATNSAGTVEGSDQAFTTGSSTPLPPVVDTGSASGVSAGGATLNGTVNPNGLSTTYHFEYGTTTSYGSTSATGSAGSGGSAVDVSKAISGLSEGTTYHYRLVATNSAGTVPGDDHSFSTAADGTATLNVDLGASGLWQYDGTTLARLSDLDPEFMIALDGELLVDFGASGGLSAYDGSSWFDLGSSNADNTGNTMVCYDNGAAMDFGAAGLWHYDGGDWALLHAADPEYMTVFNGTLLVDFGVYGLMAYDGSQWSLLASSDADNTGNTMAPFNGGAAVDFGVAGLWYTDGMDWEFLTPADVEQLYPYDGRLVCDFGALYGLYAYDGVAWEWLTVADVDNGPAPMAVFSGGLAVDFGIYGLWLYDGATWNSLSAADPEQLYVYDGDLVVDFGQVFGLYVYDGVGWTLISEADPDNAINSIVGMP